MPDHFSLTQREPLVIIGHIVNLLPDEMARKKKSYDKLYRNSTSVRGRLLWGWA
jgi:hypothetical protein